MASKNTPLLVSKKSEDAFIQYYRACAEQMNIDSVLRPKLAQLDRLYAREVDNTVEQRRAKNANSLGDPNKFQNITVPLVLSQVESAVTYQTSVFLTGSPIFGVVSNAANMDAAMQMETVIENQSIRGGWIRELNLALRDGFKYNLFAVEVDWDKQVTASLETDTTYSKTEGRPKEVIWEGNCLKRRDLYNTFFDYRVPPAEVHIRGDFAGYTTRVSCIELKNFFARLDNKIIRNVVPAFESGREGSVGYGYHVPVIVPDILNESQERETNWMSWATAAISERKITYKDTYELTKLYCRVLPSDMGLNIPAENTPQIFKLYIVNHQVVVYCERQTNAHGWIPLLFGQPLEDGLGHQTKSLARNAEPFQSLTSTLWNANIAARRRAVSDRLAYDPSRLPQALMESDSPVVRIPCRPSAYGKPIGDAIYQFPFRDEQSANNTQEVDQLIRLSNMVSGQNPVRQGQFVKGNKTVREFDTVMANVNGRDQTASLLLEAQFFTPIKEIIKLNILQYQGATQLYNRDKKVAVDIDPVALRKSALEFKVTDGLVPAEKILNADTLATALQVFGSSPQIAAEYNIGPLFSYMIKTQGGNISEFEKSREQVEYERAMMVWQNQMQTLSEAISKVAEPQQVEVLIKQLPPQPKPQDFGYNPGNSSANP